MREPDRRIAGMAFYERVTDENDRRDGVARRAILMHGDTMRYVIQRLRNGEVICSCDKWECEHLMPARIYFAGPTPDVTASA